MARVEDWYIPYTDSKEKLRHIRYFVLFYLLFTLSYFLGYIGELASYFFLAGAIMTAIGAILNRRHNSAPYFFIIGFTLILGIGLFSFNNIIFTIFMFIFLASLIIMFLMIEIWVSKTQERLKVFTSGNYSVKLIQKIDSEFENLLTSLNYLYQKYGSTFQMDFEDKERIIVGLRTQSIKDETEYKFILRTNKNRNTERFIKIKSRVNEIITKLVDNGDFDTYPQIESIICEKCGKNAYYNEAHGKIFCNRCSKFRKFEEVTIKETIKPPAES